MAETTNTVCVRPKVTGDLLINPGMGFTTFQRFNGDVAGTVEKWSSAGFSDDEEFHPSFKNKNYPDTSIAYSRRSWRILEPEKGEYRWDLIDKFLQTARARNQSLMFRVSPYGREQEADVPAWYREKAGKQEEPLPYHYWRTDPEDPLYAEHFGGFVRAMGERYDGHPDLDSIDVSIVGLWGEGAGAERLTQKTREALVDAYLESFTRTPLIMLLTDEKTNGYGLSKANVGWRVDCLGDMGGFNVKDWSHMLDLYPQRIIRSGMEDAWKKAPVSFEACWVMQHWKDKGWDIDYIIEQSLKWHVSSFNNKSSPVPEEWEPAVEKWLKKMGYRLALRKFTYPSVIAAGSELSFTSWWENLGVAPCYKRYPLAFRLKNDDACSVIKTEADITGWLPGDSLYDSSVIVPEDTEAGRYELQVGILDKFEDKPKVKLAIEGENTDGWYTLGGIEVRRRTR